MGSQESPEFPMYDSLVAYRMSRGNDTPLRDLLPVLSFDDPDALSAAPMKHKGVPRASQHSQVAAPPAHYARQSRMGRPRVGR